MMGSLPMVRAGEINYVSKIEGNEDMTVTRGYIDSD